MSYKKMADNVSSFLKQADWNDALLQSNKAINKLPRNAEGMMSGIPRSISNMRHAEMSFGDAVKTAHQTAEGSYSPLAIAGSYMGASAAYRVASGGGLYRDRHGNTNVAALPLI